MFFDPSKYKWKDKQEILKKSFNCVYCKVNVSSAKGYMIGSEKDNFSTQIGGIYICPNCYGPNFLDTWNKKDLWHSAGKLIGRSVKNVPENLNGLYEDARECYKNKRLTATVVLCEKIIMNIGVDHGAKKNLSFSKYADFFFTKGIISKDIKRMVEHINKSGNEATYKIKMMNESDTTDLIKFTEIILLFLYEFPAKVFDEPF